MSEENGKKQKKSSHLIGNKHALTNKIQAIAGDPKFKVEVKYTGAPTKYKEEYCEQLVEHMSQGFSFESFAGLIGVDKDTLYEWKKVYRIFSESYKKGCSARRLYDERILKEFENGNNKSAAAPIIFKMKSVHRLTDDVIGARKLKLLQIDKMSMEEIKELAVKFLLSNKKNE